MAPPRTPHAPSTLSPASRHRVTPNLTGEGVTCQCNALDIQSSSHSNVLLLGDRSAFRASINNGESLTKADANEIAAAMQK